MQNNFWENAKSSQLCGIWNRSDASTMLVITAPRLLGVFCVFFSTWFNTLVVCTPALSGMTRGIY